jgi:hypothetical protein
VCAAPESPAPWPRPDWSAPWLAPYAADGAAVREQVEAGVALPVALNQRLAASAAATALHTLSFVPQTELPPGVAYESHVYCSGAVPTREGLHDFFNGLCWLRFPLTKTQLNRLQAAAIDATGVGQVRGPLRDAITLFDENAALLQAPEALWQALLARNWQRLFVELRPLWADARLVLFGHALHEKLVAPYKSITAHVYRVPVPPALGADLAGWDAWLAGQLNADALCLKPFTPLPLLGVPGWWRANEDPGFYADAQVFRPPRPGASN